ncbi:MAG: ABC transporter ATP-binding protein [Actinomycetota bacterium]|nr:ABC transporter ATP-binding protein [Actinomycetota bacterium]
MTKRAGELIKEELEALDHPERGTDPSAATPGDTTNHGTIGSGIQINGLTKTYERVTRKEIVRTHALSGVDLQVRSKEFVSLIGPSGCGKTTVLKIIAGLLRPTKGDVLIEGRRVTGPGTDRATVFQSPGLMPWKSVIDNVILALEFADVSKAQRRGRAIKYVDRVGLREFHDHYPGELSGGMQQRVGIARALAIEPQVLLMDEPFGALDAMTRGHMQTELVRIWEQERRTVLFITHSIDEAILLSDRIIVMTDGSIREEVKVDIERPRSREGLLEDRIAIDLRHRLIKLL